MSGIKTACYFALGFVGDGTATTKQVSFASGPWILGGLSGVGAAPQMSAGFALGSLLPTRVTVVSSSDGQAVSNSIGGFGTNVTFTWPVAIPNDTYVSIYGYFDF